MMPLCSQKQRTNGVGVRRRGDGQRRLPMMLCVTAVLSCIGAQVDGAGVSQQQDNNPLKHDNKCWAEIYMNSDFDKNGPRLLLVGPHELATLKGLKDQNWNNDIESIIVGPEASMVLYEHPEFEGRTLIVAANQTLSNLTDAQMKNKSESLRLSCK